MSKLSSILKSIAPTLASALVPGGPLVGAAVGHIAGVLLGDKSKTQAEVEAAVESMSPVDRARLGASDKDFEKYLLDHGFKMAKLEADDRGQARDMAMKLGLNFHNRLTLVLLAAALILDVYIGHNTFSGAKLDTFESSTVINLVNFWHNGLLLALGFYFGSSFGSNKKDQSK